jgi:hypothetical protein
MNTEKVREKAKMLRKEVKKSTLDPKGQFFLELKFKQSFKISSELKSIL